MARLACVLAVALLVSLQPGRALRAAVAPPGPSALAAGPSEGVALTAGLPDGALPAYKLELQCMAAIAATANQSFGLAKTVLAQGLSLPCDAGKYEMCLAAPRSRYYLASASLPLPSAGGMPGAPLTVRLGLCLPRACSRADAAGLARGAAGLAARLAGRSGAAAPSPAITASASSPELDLRPPGRGSAVALAVFGLLSCLVIWASCVEATSPPLLAAFKLSGPQGSWARLWECQPRGGLDCLNGMRAMSMFWVVVGHSFLYTADVTGGFANGQDIYKNPLNPEAVERHPPGLLLIMNGQVVVDTFLLISGLLQSIQTLELLHAGGEGGRAAGAGFAARGRLLLAGVAQRYLRLTPSLVLVWLCYHFLVPQLARGPFAPRLQEQIFSRCDDTWWASFLYVQALFPTNKDRMCMKWTWYLSCDMIYFAIGLLVLPLHLGRPRLLWAVLAVLLAGSLAIGTVLANRYPLELDPSWVHSRGWGAVYVNPAVRVVPFIVGLGLGILERGAEPTAGGGAGRGPTERGGAASAGEAVSKAPAVATPGPLRLAAAWAACAASLGAMALVVMLPQTNLGDHKNSWRPWQVTLYTVASRPVWALACGCLALLCRRGLPGAVVALLSHPLWTPLARLTYGAYLVHPLVIKLAAGRQLQFLTFSAWDYGQRCLANTAMAYGASVVLWVLAERPVAVLASSALKRPQAPSEPGSKGASA